MTTVNTYTTKLRIKNDNRATNSSVFLDGVTSIASGGLKKNDPTLTSVVTAATSRIGKNTVRRKEVVVKEIVEDGTLGVKRIGRVTVLGDSISTHDISDFKQGHNVKRIEETSCSMLPHVTVNAPQVIDEFGNIVNTYQETTFGQLYSYYFNVINDSIERKNIPFFDFPGILNPVTYIQRGEYYPAYMIINNLIEDYLHYIEPDSIMQDGAIDVFETRSQRANTGTADIQTKGIRASFASGPWDLPSGATTELRRGTSPISDVFDTKDHEYDFFEDCQDLVFGDSSFSEVRLGSVKNHNVSGYKYALDGYVSTGKYIDTPFRDTTSKDRAYEGVDYPDNSHLLANLNNNESLRDISSIGIRFKSSHNGSILRPKYDNTIQTISGTDSIAFAGYMRE